MFFFKSRRSKSPETPPKKISSTRTVTLVSDQAVITDELLNKNTSELSDEDDEPTAKRMRIEPFSSRIVERTDWTEDTDETSSGFKSQVILSKEINNNEDYQRDFDERRHVITSSSLSKTSLRLNSKKHDKDQHQSRPRRRPLPHQESSNDPSRRSRTYSRSSMNGRRTTLMSTTPRRKPSIAESRVDRHRYHPSHSNSLPDPHDLLPEKSYRTPLPSSSSASSYHPRAIGDLLGTTNGQHSSSSQSHKKIQL